MFGASSEPGSELAVVMEFGFKSARARCGSAHACKNAFSYGFVNMSVYICPSSTLPENGLNDVFLQQFVLLGCA